jgi:hypothetical protein
VIVVMTILVNLIGADRAEGGQFELSVTNFKTNALPSRLGRSCQMRWRSHLVGSRYFMTWNTARSARRTVSFAGLRPRAVGCSTRLAGANG